MNEYAVVKLTKKDEDELKKVITESFGNLPQMPIMIKKPRQGKEILKALVDMYNSNTKMIKYGIKEDGILTSAFFCTRADFNPSLIKQLVFGFKILRKLGLEGVLQFWKIQRSKPKHRSNQIELVMLVTLPLYQGKGRGKEILNFLYDYAKKKNYLSVVAVTNSKKPAFKFYLKQGWIIEKKFINGKDEFCWIKKIL